MPVPYSQYVDRDPVALMAGTLEDYRTVLAGVSGAGWQQPWQPGKWSLREIVVHVAQWEMIFGYHLKHNVPIGYLRIGMHTSLLACDRQERFWDWDDRFVRCLGADELDKATEAIERAAGILLGQQLVSVVVAQGCGGGALNDGLLAAATIAGVGNTGRALRVIGVDDANQIAMIISAIAIIDAVSVGSEDAQAAGAGPGPSPSLEASGGGIRIVRPVAVSIPLVGQPAAVSGAVSRFFTSNKNISQ